ncbi:MAG: tripartite tricarboxylate transporter substrate binding protein [Pseudomonadota bacterium]
MFGAITATLLLFAGEIGQAETFPNRPITLINPWPPGGSTDIQLRALAEIAGKTLGQPVVVENKPGAAGSVGPAQMAATAKPDGYTIAQIPLGVFRQPFLVKTTYDPAKDFTYIIGLTYYSYGVVVRADAPWQTWRDFIDYAKANPDKVIYATPGAGSVQNVVMEKIAAQEGLKWRHVPSRGTAENNAALLGGHVTAMADGTGWAPLVDSGQFRLLVTWGEARMPAYPDIPTLKELGYGIAEAAPYGLAGPKGMDPQVVTILHDAFKTALFDPEHVKILERLHQGVAYLDSAQYRALALEQIAEQKDVVVKYILPAAAK